MNRRVVRPRGGTSRSGFGTKGPDVVKFMTVRISTQLIERDPWGCFDIIAREARIRGVAGAQLELNEARELWNFWEMTFEVTW